MTRPLLTLAILALLFSAPLAANAQDANLPVIRANSTSVDVRDGRNFRKGHWGIDPTAVLDVYYAQRSTTPKKVVRRASSGCESIRTAASRTSRVKAWTRVSSSCSGSPTRTAYS